jgi:uncharacterized protein YmfQ (DUF2313 family)
MALTDQIVSLLPSGEAWPRASASNLWQTVNLFSNAVQRIMNWADYAQQDVFPLSSHDTLLDWRASVGTYPPDPLCPVLTPAQYILQMHIRVLFLGGASIAMFVNYAAMIGYTITITELAVPRAGLSKVGQSATNGPGADNVWCVTVANATLTPFRVGINRAGDALNTASSIAFLEYELGRIAPAETQLEYFV